MAIHRVNGKDICTWQNFHDYFESEFNFPGYYGRNMDAWNDCMSDIVEAEIITLHITSVNELKEKGLDIYEAIVECSAFVNWRCTEKGGLPLIALSFYG